MPIYTHPNSQMHKILQISPEPLSSRRVPKSHQRL